MGHDGADNTQKKKPKRCVDFTGTGTPASDATHKVTHKHTSDTREAHIHTQPPAHTQTCGEALARRWYGKLSTGTRLTDLFFRFVCFFLCFLWPSIFVCCCTLLQQYALVRVSVTQCVCVCFLFPLPPHFIHDTTLAHTHAFFSFLVFSRSFMTDWLRDIRFSPLSEPFLVIALLCLSEPLAFSFLFSLPVHVSTLTRRAPR